jgi:cytochrome c oxidase subunit 3
MRYALVDVSELPEVTFGHRSTIWWGVLGLVAIEGSVFAMLAVSALYLRQSVPLWPPAGTPLPRLLAATTNVGVLLVSLLPMIRVHRNALARRPRAVAIGLAICTGLTLVSLALRGLEFRALQTRWDSHAYGSIAWTILGMHSTHLITAALENVLLILVIARGLHEEKHFVDVEVNALYWYFVVGAWLPLYALVFLVPRWL